MQSQERNYVIGLYLYTMIETENLQIGCCKPLLADDKSCFIVLNIKNLKHKDSCFDKVVFNNVKFIEGKNIITGGIDNGIYAHISDKDGCCRFSICFTNNYDYFIFNIRINDIDVGRFKVDLGKYTISMCRK